MKDKIFFYDVDGNSCNSDNAISFYHIVLNDSGNMISEKIGKINNKSG